MPPLVLAVSIPMASVLLWAGLEKGRQLSATAATLSQLRLPKGSTRAAAALLVVVEISAAVGLILQPHSGVVLAAVLGLALAFAGAALVALHRGERISCSCFGPGSGDHLGRSQLLALPIWFGGAVVLWGSDASGPSDPPRAVLLAAVALVMATLRAGNAISAALAARGDRQSAREMLLWLSR